MDTAERDRRREPLKRAVKRIVEHFDELSDEYEDEIKRLRIQLENERRRREEYADQVEDLQEQLNAKENRIAALLQEMTDLDVKVTQNQRRRPFSPGGSSHPPPLRPVQRPQTSCTIRSIESTPRRTEASLTSKRNGGDRDAPTGPAAKRRRSVVPTSSDISDASSDNTGIIGKSPEILDKSKSYGKKSEKNPIRKSVMDKTVERKIKTSSTSRSQSRQAKPKTATRTSCHKCHKDFSSSYLPKHMKLCNGDRNHSDQRPEPSSPGSSSTGGSVSSSDSSVNLVEHNESLQLDKDGKNWMAEISDSDFEVNGGGRDSS